MVDDTDDDDDDDDDEALGLFTAEDSEKKGHAPIQVSVMLQLDTGATVSILPKTLTSSLIRSHCGVLRLS